MAARSLDGRGVRHAHDACPLPLVTGCCGRVAFESAVVVRKFPLPTLFGVGALLCCAAGTRAITSVFRMVWEAFIDWKA